MRGHHLRDSLHTQGHHLRDSLHIREQLHSIHMDCHKIIPPLTRRVMAMLRLVMAMKLRTFFFFSANILGFSFFPASILEQMNFQHLIEDYILMYSVHKIHKVHDLHKVHQGIFNNQIKQMSFPRTMLNRSYTSMILMVMSHCSSERVRLLATFK